MMSPMDFYLLGIAAAIVLVLPAMAIDLYRDWKRGPQLPLPSLFKNGVNEIFKDAS